MAKTKVAVLFGGVSSEYEVSCMSAAAVADALVAAGCEVVKVGITPKGRWFLYPGATDAMRGCSWDKDPDCVTVALSPDRVTRGLIVGHGPVLDVIKLDCVFPVLHGRNGEDGTVQGLLELSGLPYVGCDVLASAACMNKAVANTLLTAANIPHTPWFALHRKEAADLALVERRMAETGIGYPLFVKPAVGGSSVGIAKVHSPDELLAAIQLASAHDRTVVFEKAVQGAEVECAVLGNMELTVSQPGEIVPCNEIYDYEAKYQSGDASQLFIPARLSAEKCEEVRALALRAYTAAGCSGLSRVDFFVTEDGQVQLNEINTMPGFTSISMYPKLMEHAGLSFPALVLRLVELAFERAGI